MLDRTSSRARASASCGGATPQSEAREKNAGGGERQNICNMNKAKKEMRSQKDIIDVASNAPAPPAQKKKKEKTERSAGKASSHFDVLNNLSASFSLCSPLFPCRSFPSVPSLIEPFAINVSPAASSKFSGE